MIILPDRNIPRARFLMPVREAEWREPSLAQAKDQFGNQNCTRFFITARANDGGIVWRGWFDDRDDFDAFLWAIACDTLRYERPLWDLPTPAWEPWLGELISYEFASQVNLTTPTGASTTNIPSDWTNTNTLHTLGGGGSGGTAYYAASASQAIGAGGGGGAWNSVTNTTSYTARQTGINIAIGVGGAAVSFIGFGAGTYNSSTGNTGGDTWFGATTLGSSTVGAKGGSGGQAAYSGTAAGVSANGGAGGVGSSGVGTSNNSGGRGGNSSVPSATNGGAGAGGGGAAGPNGAGNQGGDISAVSQSSGGRGDGTSGGAGGASGSGGGVANSGSAGTEWASVGSGGGGAGNRGFSATAGAGGNYGAGSGGIGGANTASGGSVTGAAAAQGVIVLIYTPFVYVGPSRLRQYLRR